MSDCCSPIPSLRSQPPFSSQIEGVAGVGDLHVWSLTPGIPLLCAHVATQPGAVGEEVLSRVTAYVRRLGIQHSTLQIVGPEEADKPHVHHQH